MKSVNTITLLLREKNIKVDARLSDYSRVLAEADQSEPIDVNMMSHDSLKLILEFYQNYGYGKINEVKIISNSLSTNLGIYYDFFKKFTDKEEKLLPEKLKGLLEACFHYDFFDLKELCLVAMATPFYYPDKKVKDSDKESSKFEIPPQEYIQIIDKYKNFLISMERYFKDDSTIQDYQDEV